MHVARYTIHKSHTLPWSIFALY